MPRHVPLRAFAGAVALVLVLGACNTTDPERRPGPEPGGRDQGPTPSESLPTEHATDD